MDHAETIEELTRDSCRALLPERPEESNKATFGSVLNIAGSVNYRGAACLSTLAALKVGAGYATLACPQIIANSISAYSPDIVTIPLKTRDGRIGREAYREIAKVFRKFTVLSVGCGLSGLFGDNRNLQAFFRKLLETIQDTGQTVVIDADGLNLLSKLPPVALPAHTVLTPHPKELGRLLHAGTDEIQANRIAAARAAARQFHAVIVLKGHRTVITDGEKTFVNTTGNSALAKAGSGDILTGMTAGFAAQGASALDAARLAVYLHGKAGDLAKEEYSAYGVLASDLIGFIPGAVKTLIQDR